MIHRLKKIVDLKKFYNTAMLQPPVRIELTTPGLQDQCSSHWAMEAHMVECEMKKKQANKQSN